PTGARADVVDRRIRCATAIHVRSIGLGSGGCTPARRELVARHAGRVSILCDLRRAVRALDADAPGAAADPPPARPELRRHPADAVVVLLDWPSPVRDGARAVAADDGKRRQGI